MILFVFEGERREPYLFKALERLYFSQEGQNIICSFGNSVYELYKQLKLLSEIDDSDAGDIVSLLMKHYRNKPDNPFVGISDSSDFSEIYLFFDYDFHDDHNRTVEELNRQLKEMLLFFDNETERGKLFINYPMVESIRYTKELPDADYYGYSIEKSKCATFKQCVSEFSHYRNFDFICKGDCNAKQNWDYLKLQNVRKANWLCNDDTAYPPVSKESVSQWRIFNAQLIKYVNTEVCSVSILNSFPIFLFEYFK